MADDLTPEASGPTRESETAHAAMCDAEEAYREALVGVIRTAAERGMQEADVASETGHQTFEGGPLDDLPWKRAADAVLAVPNPEVENLRYTVEADGRAMAELAAERDQARAEVERLRAGYSSGWVDATKAARKSVGTYLGYPSANGVAGFGPAAVIVDGDWLAARIAELDALRAEIGRHPDPHCDAHPDSGPIACGWKRAYVALVELLGGS